jgi:hypothetical protein
MRDREVLVLTPPQDGWQTVQVLLPAEPYGRTAS